MHKKIKLFVSMLAAAAMLVLLPGSNVLTANAAEGNTYSLKYFGGDINDWRYVSGNTFEDGLYHRELYYLKELLKDGDTIVIYAGDVNPSKDLDLGNVKLNNLTVHQNAQAVVFTGGVKDCYVLAGACTAINGDVTNAYLYDTTTCTFNNNVLDMVLNITDKPYSNISCAGTVGHYRTVSSAGGHTDEFYDIPKNTMKLENGTIQFAVWSPTPSDEYLQARAAADGTAAAETAPNTSSGSSTTPSTPAADTSSDEYDRVPKTGDSNNVIWLVSLVGAAAVLFAGSYGLYKKAN